MKPLFSIIVPVYKVEEYLDECMTSILAQTFSAFEVILIDDGSPDNCPAMCDAWAQKDSRITVIHKENGGVSSARNAAIPRASGEWIWFVDSDDTLESGALDRLSQLVSRNPDLIIFNKEHSEEYKKDNRFFEEYYFQYRFGFEAWNKLYKASIIHQNRLQFDTQESIGEDLLFNLEYYRYAKQYLFLDKDLYSYRVREDSAMGTKDSDRLQKQLSVFSKIYEMYRDDTDEIVLAQLFIMHLISGINQSNKRDLKCAKNYSLVDAALKRYAFSKPVFQEAVKRFLSNENASLGGKLRTIMFFKLLFKSVETAFVLF